MLLRLSGGGCHKSMIDKSSLLAFLTPIRRVAAIELDVARRAHRDRSVNLTGSFEGL